MHGSKRFLMLPALLLPLVLLGCAGSPPARYYTLQSDPAQRIEAPAQRANYQIEVAPVTVPQQADQPQIMVREHRDDGALTPL